MATAFRRSLWTDDDLEARTRRGIMDGLGTAQPVDTGTGLATPREPDVSGFTGLTARERRSLPGGRNPLAHPRNGAPSLGTATPLDPDLWGPAPYPGAGTSTTEPGTPTTPGGLPPVLPGWDAVKWADPAHNTIKYVSGRIFAKYQPSDWLNPTTRDQILAELRGAGLNPTVVGDDSIDFNDGYGPIDVVQGAGAGGQAWQWLPRNAAGGAGTTGTAATGTGVPVTPTVGVGGAGGGVGTGTTGTEGTSELDAAIRQKLLDFLARDNTNISVEDPNLRPAAQAYGNAAQRETQRRREIMAERMAAQGMGDSGAMDAEIASGLQDEGVGVANFEANLVLQEMQSRREELQQALTLGAGLITAEQQRALQAELANLDAAIRREAMALQNQQFNDTLGFNIGDREAYWNAVAAGMID